MTRSSTKVGSRTRRTRIGRPPLGASARSEIVTLKVTKAELAAVRAAVRKLGPPATVAGWFRDHALAPLGLGSFAGRRRAPKRSRLR
jgi:hypothetical protein